MTEGRVRLFHQTELGIEAKRYVDTGIEGVQLGAADLDGDGCDELIVTADDRPPRIYWGGEGGLDPGRFTEVPVPEGWEPPGLAETELLSEEERVGPVAPLAVSPGDRGRAAALRGRAAPPSSWCPSTTTAPSAGP